MPKVLVVEDNRSLAAMAKVMIETRLGLQVVLAGSGAEARGLIEADSEGFAVALVDLNLPDAPDGEVVPFVQSHDIPVVVLTGYFGDAIREKMLKLGVVDYVVKKNISAYEYACRLVERIHHNYRTKVLVVDDSRSAVANLKHYLSIQRLNVLTASNGIEALGVLEQHPDIRLVITDYNMPEMDGFELIQQLRSRFAKNQMAIIGLSSSADPRLSAHFLKSGANDFISKPFSYEELLCRVNQNLEYLEQIDLIRDAANRDYLTKLYNRRYFFEQGESVKRQALRQDRPLSLSMIDIDHFKSINDTYGHSTGDEALKHVAGLLNESFPDDLVARFGGEEFCIMHRRDEGESQQQLENFREKVANSPLPSDSKIRVTVSIGLNGCCDQGLDDIIHLADTKLYQAKEQGRNRLIV
ncbi:diguanylate cyclase [Spongiibacter sp. KMU-158]|uniref:diguanylate cyclase n=1 Tax=Spongiibacter pelagi TaxID=2760804 RepID=A0A927GYA3_9GAMM|nr:diguanylate cyclase [Spongiibacter pelagi]MBD2860239.1 diguanylate cyclase [Spongiibacter pelagi]